MQIHRQHEIQKHMKTTEFIEGLMGQTTNITAVEFWHDYGIAYLTDL